MKMERLYMLVVIELYLRNLKGFYRVAKRPKDCTDAELTRWVESIRKYGKG